VYSLFSSIIFNKFIKHKHYFIALVKQFGVRLVNAHGMKNQLPRNKVHLGFIYV